MKDNTYVKIKTEKIRLCREDKIYYTSCYIIVALLTLLVFYPILYILAASFSDGNAVVSGKVWLWPVDVSLQGYKVMLGYKSVWIGYRNTIFYTMVGTVINIAMTMICAYPLTRKNLRGRKIIMFIFTFTMFFGGGMIPSYLLVKNLKMLDTVWALLLPGAMSVYNMIVARTFMQSNIPDELLEAAKIDGCSDSKFFFGVVLPLSKTIIAVLAMWYAVGHWNSYFSAFLYLKDKNLYPLQIYLREILVQNQFKADQYDPDLAVETIATQAVLKYCLIVISTAPLMMVYPFFQKYFVKGVMLGSIKG